MNAETISLLLYVTAVFGAAANTQDAKCSKNEAHSECGTSCQHVCKQLVPSICSSNCVSGCFCKPGFVRSTPKGPCVPLEGCLPLCKENMEYTSCLEACPAKCNRTRTEPCSSGCHGAGCKCKDGFVPHEIKLDLCVPKAECVKHA